MTSYGLWRLRPGPGAWCYFPDGPNRKLVLQGSRESAEAERAVFCRERDVPENFEIVPADPARRPAFVEGCATKPQVRFLTELLRTRDYNFACRIAQAGLATRDAVLARGWIFFTLNDEPIVTEAGLRALKRGELSSAK